MVEVVKRFGVSVLEYRKIGSLVVYAALGVAWAVNEWDWRLYSDVTKGFVTYLGAKSLKDGLVGAATELAKKAPKVPS